MSRSRASMPATGAADNGEGGHAIESRLRGESPNVRDSISDFTDDMQPEHVDDHSNEASKKRKRELEDEVTVDDDKDAYAAREDIINTQLLEPFAPADPQVDWSFEDEETARLVDDNEDVYATTNTQLLEPLASVDPQVAWSIEDEGVSKQPSNVGKPMTKSPNAIEKVFQTPPEISAAEEGPRRHSITVVINPRYITFLTDICVGTGTHEANPFVETGLFEVVPKFQSLGLERDRPRRLVAECYAYGLVIWLWLAGCYKTRFGAMPPLPDMQMATELAALFNAAHAIMQKDCAIPYDQLASVVRHWGERSRQLGFSNNNWWETRTWLTQIPSDILASPQSRDRIADDYVQTLLTKGKGQLTLKMVDENLGNPQRDTVIRKMVTANSRNRSWVLEEMLDIMAAMDTSLLIAFMDGSLSRRARNPPNEDPVAKHLSDMMQQPLPPSIYVNMICDYHGYAPTPEQWQIVINYMSRYVHGGRESDSLALTLDQLIHPIGAWPPELAEQHLHRYTEYRTYTVKNETKPDKERRKIVKLFVAEMQGRINSHSSQGKAHTPFEAPVINIGFSKNPEHRLDQHRRHRSSNYLMNLAEACFQHHFPDQFGLKQQIIYHCFSNSQPWLAEIALTQLGQGYTEGGQGFSHCTAGNSNRSAFNALSAHEWIRLEQKMAEAGYLVSERKKIALEVSAEYQKVMDERDRIERRNAQEIEYYTAMSEAVDSLTEYLEAWQSEMAQMER